MAETELVQKEKTTGCYDLADSPYFFIYFFIQVDILKQIRYHTYR